MAAIRFDKLFKPQQVFSNQEKTKEESLEKNIKFIYSDLHLDLTLQTTIGQGNNPANSGDIKVDYDENAVKNSIRNIFTTKKGQKLLNPEFGAALDQFLFERVDEFYGYKIGNEILDTIKLYEPRIEVTKIQVIPDPDQNEYRIILKYNFLKMKNNEKILNFNLLSNGQILI